MYPKQIKKGMIVPENEEDGAITHAGCGRSISLVLPSSGDL